MPPNGGSGLEDACEDHGQTVIYRGTIAEHPHVLPFDKHYWILPSARPAGSAGLLVRPLASRRARGGAAGVARRTYHHRETPNGRIAPYGFSSWRRKVWA